MKRAQEFVRNNERRNDYRDFRNNQQSSNEYGRSPYESNSFSNFAEKQRQNSTTDFIRQKIREAER